MPPGSPQPQRHACPQFCQCRHPKDVRRWPEGNQACRELSRPRLIAHDNPSGKPIVAPGIVREGGRYVRIDDLITDNAHPISGLASIRRYAL